MKIKQTIIFDKQSLAFMTPASFYSPLRNEKFRKDAIHLKKELTYPRRFIYSWPIKLRFPTFFLRIRPALGGGLHIISQWGHK